MEPALGDYLGLRLSDRPGYDNQVTLCQDQIRIGKRPATSDVIIGWTPRVSGTHVVLAWRDSAWWARDAGAVNGTRLNGEWLRSEEERVRWGDRLILAGDVILELRWDPKTGK